MITYTIEIDFDRDFTNCLVEELQEHGYTVRDDIDRDELKIQYFNFKKRIVPAMQRQIHRAPDLLCPPEHQAGLDQVIGKIERGEDLRPHLSENILKLKYSDAMLNDWGIYHLHLGTTLKANGFMERTGPLLYARFDQTEAYLIQVYDHGAWTQQKLVRTLWLNWPASLKQFRLPECDGLNIIPTDEGIKKLRKARMNAMVQVQPGVVLAPLGGGVTMTAKGVSMEVVRTKMYYDRLMSDWEAIVKEKSAYLGKVLTEQHGLKGDRLVFSLGMQEGKFLAVENQTKVSFPLA